VIGRAGAAEISKEARCTGHTVRAVAAGRKVLPPDELGAVLNACRMTEPGLWGKGRSS
jgi:aspartate ammonia-lyase